jgi:hypothetical protein
VHAKLTLKGLAFGIGTLVTGVLFLAILPALTLYSPDNGASYQVLQLHGKVDIMLYDEDGNIKDERHFDNLIVDSGFEGVAYEIAPHNGAATTGPWNYIAIGTGSTAPAAGDTALVSELARLQDGTATYSTTSGKQLQLQVSFGPGQGTGNIAESGLFNAGIGGDMLARQTFSTISKGASDTLNVTWTITLS